MKAKQPIDPILNQYLDKLLFFCQKAGTTYLICALFWYPKSAAKASFFCENLHYWNLDFAAIINSSPSFYWEALWVVTKPGKGLYVVRSYDVQLWAVLINTKGHQNLPLVDFGKFRVR